MGKKIEISVSELNSFNSIEGKLITNAIESFRILETTQTAEYGPVEPPLGNMKASHV